MTASVTAVPAAATHQLDLSLVRDTGGRTHIGGQYVAYPFHLCRALRTLGDPPDMPTLYIQSCSGGLFEGDDLRCRINVGARARAHITTAAATVVHSMETGTSAMRVDIDAAPGAYLEYLPDPLILFPGASLANTVNIRLADGATVLAWDSFLAHDPKQQGRVFRDLTSELTLREPGGRLLARDRYCAQGTAFASGTPGVMGPHRTQAGFVVARCQAPVDQWLDGLRAALSEGGTAPGESGASLSESGSYVDGSGTAWWGVSALPNDAGVWVRVLAPDAAQSSALLHRAWSCARTMITGVAPAARRK